MTKLMDNKALMGIIAIIAGFLIIFVPELMRWVVGILLIVLGILWILGKK